ncbi:MAG: tetratricopeptide repeat protein [candidate division WOR-3 bacterium]|nr:MAG: tetratricopeptide repeat protein [candidate division WOR-3 bacterium]
MRNKQYMLMRPVAASLLAITAFWSIGCVGQRRADVVIGKEEKIFSRVLNEERIIIVSLPGGYDASEKDYPVLYVLDADFMPSFARVVGTVGQQSHFAQIPEMIIVGIKNVDRERDMFPENVERWPTSGGADNFLKFLTDELIPHVDRTYRTENFKVLYGESNAGLFVVYALLSRPESFDAYLTSSPMVGWCYQLIYDKARALFKNRESLHAFLYMIWGKGDLPAVTRAVPYFISIIEQEAPEDFTWSSRVVEDEGHVPYASLLHCLRFLFNEWLFPESRFETATLEEIQGYYQQLSDKYGFEVAIPMFVYLETGNSLRGRGRVEEALDVFILNLEKYPTDPNAHFYLGEGYWDNGQKDLAIQHYRKALEFNPNYSPAIQKLKAMEEGR